MPFAAATMELFVLGLVFGVGAAKRKAVTKAVAKSYMAVTEKTKTVASTLREDMRDAVAEARDQGDRDTEDLDQAAGVPAGEYNEELIALQEATTSAPVAVGGSSAAAEPVAEAKPRGSLLKSLARGYVAVTESTRNAAAGLREEMRDAVEEARYERSQAALRAQQVIVEPDPAQEAVSIETDEAVAGEATPTPVEVVQTPRVKRKYTRSTTTQAAAPVAAAQSQRASKTVAPKQNSGRKAAVEERQREEAIGERLLEVAEIIGEATL